VSPWRKDGDRTITGPQDSRVKRLLQQLHGLWSEHSVLLAFIVVTILASFGNGVFLTPSNLVNILRQVSIVGVISLGQCLVILTGGIDLSVGAVLALVGGLTITVLNATHSVFLSVVFALLLGTLIGALNGVLITKGRITPFIVTLGTLACARSAILYFAHGGGISGHVGAYMLISDTEILGISLPIYLFLICTIGISLVARKTRFGRYVYAIGGNERAALLSAINVDRIKMGAYVLSGCLTGLASLIESSRLSSISSASSGIGYELDSIAAVIVGGTRLSGGKGSIIGTFLGVLILGMLNNILNLMNVSPYLQGFVKGLIIIFAVLLQKRD
jgi:ribose transport system permease protein